METTIRFDKQYLEYAKINTWDLGNQVLYDLCAKFPQHRDKSEVVAKIWLIGRSYAASVERRKNKSKNNYDFYEDIVAPTMINSKLDQYLTRLNGEKKISESNIETILATHKYLVDILEKITKLNKRSLASKYLHFHYPHLFYLFDSRASNSLRDIVRSKKANEKYSNYDSTYVSFYLKAYELHNFIKDKYDIDLSPRELDKILLWIY